MTQEEQIRLYRLMEKLNWFFHQEMHYHQLAASYISQAPEDAALRSCGSVCALRGPVRPQHRTCGNGTAD